MSVIELPRTLVNQLLAHAQAGGEQEVCGLIAQRPDQGLTCYPVANVAPDAGHRFELEPAGQIAVMRRMRERGEQLFAIYHSHPDAPALPSAEDLRHDEYPEALRLIVSLNTTGVLELRGFRIAHGQVEELALTLPE